MCRELSSANSLSLSGNIVQILSGIFSGIFCFYPILFVLFCVSYTPLSNTMQSVLVLFALLERISLLCHVVKTSLFLFLMGFAFVNFILLYIPFTVQYFLSFLEIHVNACIILSNTMCFVCIQICLYSCCASGKLGTNCRACEITQFLQKNITLQGGCIC